MDYDRLYQEACLAQKKSYSPYSHFSVGCALQLNDGTFIHGANIENASYGASICAERVAMCHKQMNYKEENTVVAVAIVGNSKEECTTPCGICRQFLREFLSLDTPIMMFNDKGTKHKTLSLEQLLPESFGPAHLQ